MIARIQQFLTLVLLLAGAAWASLFAMRGNYALAASGALLIVLGYALFLGVEFLLLVTFGADATVARPTALQLLRAWIGEALRAPLVFCWRQPFRSRHVPDMTVDARAGQRGVVFVHGFFCNRGFWNSWMTLLRDRGIPFVAVNLEPAFGSIATYAGIIESAVVRIEAATGLSPVIVAHSMGGLAVRAWLAGRAGSNPPHRVITIASPHRGTWLARFSRAVNGLEMRSPSDWIEALAARESADRSRFTCFYGHCDNIVFPASVGTLPGADNRHVPATAHVQMAYRAEVVNEALRWLSPIAPTGEPARVGPAGAAQLQADFPRS